jgi:hypothetical protein
MAGVGYYFRPPEAAEIRNSNHDLKSFGFGIGGTSVEKYDLPRKVLFH